MARVERTSRMFLTPEGGPSWKVVGTVDAGDRIPAEIPRYGAILVAIDSGPTWIAFDCPCSAKRRIMLNLDRHRRPCWRLLESEPLTLSPSVHTVSPGHRCHFFIWNGHVYWVRHTPQRKSS